jgi:hypothetical protein
LDHGRCCITGGRIGGRRGLATFDHLAAFDQDELTVDHNELTRLPVHGIALFAATFVAALKLLRLPFFTQKLTLSFVDTRSCCQSASSCRLRSPHGVEPMAVVQAPLSGPVSELENRDPETSVGGA